VIAGRGGSGLILSDYGEGESIGVDIEKKEIMLRAFVEADR
jgi:hypothetical protein